MKLLLFSDLHLSEFSQFSTLTSTGLNSRLLEQLLVIRKIQEVAVRERVDAIFFLGDMLHGLTANIAKVIYNAAFISIRWLCQVCPVHIVIGNHDLYRNLTVLSNFETVPGVTLYETTVQLPNGIDVVPWGGVLPESKGSILLGHLDITGAVFDSATGAKSKAGILPTALSGYEYVYLGHFHVRQSIPVPGAKEAMYIGSVMAHMIGDGDAQRGVTIFEDGKTTFVAIPSPKFYELVIQTEQELEELIQKVESTPDYYRIRITNPDLQPQLTHHRLQIIYDIMEAQPLRFEERVGEDIWATTERFIRETTTAINKEEAITLLRQFRGCV